MPSLPRQNVTSNHRASDTVVCEGRPQVLNGRFMYGPLDVVTLTGEKVRTQRPRPGIDQPASGRPRPKPKLPSSLLCTRPPIAPGPAKVEPPTPFTPDDRPA